MGADAIDAAAAQAKIKAKSEAVVKALAKQACIECDRLGSWCDGSFIYCDDHVPHKLRHRGTYWREDYPTK